MTHQVTDATEPAAENSEPETVIPPFTPVAEMPTADQQTAEMEVAANETVEETSTATEANRTASENPENSASEVRGADWIMLQNKSAYTFQLMGTWERSEVDDFIEKYALTDDVAVFASMRENKVWYALLYGVYDSKSAAVTASEKWPAPLNGVSTWLRRFEGVQTQIREKAPDA